MDFVLIKKIMMKKKKKLANMNIYYQEAILCIVLLPELDYRDF